MLLIFECGIAIKVIWRSIVGFHVFEGFEVLVRRRLLVMNGERLGKLFNEGVQLRPTVELDRVWYFTCCDKSLLRSPPLTPS
jgi:hypothetical protein